MSANNTRLFALSMSHVYIFTHKLICEEKIRVSNTFSSEPFYFPTINDLCELQVDDHFFYYKNSGCCLYVLDVKKGRNVCTLFFGNENKSFAINGKRCIYVLDGEKKEMAKFNSNNGNLVAIKSIQTTDTMIDSKLFFSIGGNGKMLILNSTTKKLYFISKF